MREEFTYKLYCQQNDSGDFAYITTSLGSSPYSALEKYFGHSFRKKQRWLVTRVSEQYVPISMYEVGPPEASIVIEKINSPQNENK